MRDPSDFVGEFEHVPRIVPADVVREDGTVPLREFFDVPFVYDPFPGIEPLSAKYARIENSKGHDDGGFRRERPEERKPVRFLYPEFGIRESERIDRTVALRREMRGKRIVSRADFHYVVAFVFFSNEFRDSFTLHKFFRRFHIARPFETVATRNRFADLFDREFGSFRAFDRRLYFLSQEGNPSTPLIRLFQHGMFLRISQRISTY